MAEINTNCPACGEAMELGRLAVGGIRLRWSAVYWEEERLSPLRRTIEILRPGIGGNRTRPAWHCGACETVLIPPAAPDTSR